MYISVSKMRVYIGSKFTDILEEMRNSRDDWRIASKKRPEGGSEGIFIST